MSVLYPDLISTFPENLDTFPNYQNITPADGNLIAQYMEAMNQGNQTLANQILAQIPNATQKIIKATDLNKVMQAVLATERFFKDDIYDYILEQQENWQEIINQFAYVGTYSSGNTYNKYNMVDYTISGVKLLYIAINNVPSGTPPTSTSYWRVLTIQGTEGEPGQGLSYRQEWQPSVQYDVNQAVTYSGILWTALQPSLGIEPGTNDEIWKKVMDFSVVVYPIQPTPPINQAIGGLWFNTEDNPTNYAYLQPLTTPATSSEVLVGYQAYGEDGVILNGTAQPSGNYIPTSEKGQPEGVAPLNKDGVLDIIYGGTRAKIIQQALYNLGARSNYNHLINWDMRNPINQRGVSGTISDVGYFLDMWQLVEGIVTIEPDGLTVNGTIQQKLEFDISDVFTASALTANGEILTANYSDKVFSFTGNGQKIIAFKLEDGKNQTLAFKDNDKVYMLDKFDKISELAKCQKYYREISGGFTGYGVNDVVFLSVPQINNMLRQPTVMVNGGVGYIAISGEAQRTINYSKASILYNQVCLNDIGYTFSGYPIISTIFEWKIILSCETL